MTSCKSILWLAALLFASVPLTLAQSNPVPLINNPLVPDAVAPGGPSFTLTVNGSGPSFTLTVNGTGFVAGSTVNWNGTPLATTFVSGSQLTATVSAPNIATGGTASLTVASPPPGGGTSNADLFDVRTRFSESSFGLSSLGSVGDQLLGMIAVDVNNDGKLDLINTSESGISVSLGNGDGTFQLATEYFVPTGAAGVVASDFNGDGILDLAASSGNGLLVIFIGSGDGTFQSYQSTNDPVYYGLTAGDFNGDGSKT